MSKRLRAARIETGLSRRAFAELIGVAERTVNYYEDPKYFGKRKAIVVRAWAEACGRDFSEIWGAPTLAEQGIARNRCSVQPLTAA